MPFTNEPWDGPAVEAKLNAADYCAVCLIDANPPNAQKVKGMCKLPVRATPGGPYNKAAIRNAMARLAVTDAPPEQKRKAARKLVQLCREAGIEVGDSILRVAGMR